MAGDARRGEVVAGAADELGNPRRRPDRVTDQAVQDLLIPSVEGRSHHGDAAARRVPVARPLRLDQFSQRHP
jgi:hypothetical protein